MTKYVIRRVRPGDPRPLRHHASSSTRILLAAPGGPTARFANNPRSRPPTERAVQEGLGPGPADPRPVLPLDRRLQPRRRRDGPRDLPGAGRAPRPDRLAELPADRHQRRHERRPPRRLRLLASTRGEPVADADRPGRPADASSSPASRSSSGSRSRSSSGSTPRSNATRCSTRRRRSSPTSASPCPRSGSGSC